MRRTWPKHGREVSKVFQEERFAIPLNRSFAYCSLTPELSRGAQWPSGGVALAYTASATTKQRRLERIVRPQRLYLHTRYPGMF